MFDRSNALPGGGHLEQADGTAWMALFCQNMAEIAVELAATDPSYEEFSLKFSEHFLWIAAAINKPGEDGLWDEEDGFYYDLLRLPDGTSTRLKVRSMVGLLPLCATTIIEKSQREIVANATARFFQERLKRMPYLLSTIHPTGPGHLGVNDRGIMALVNPERLRRILARMLEKMSFFHLMEFALSPVITWSIHTSFAMADKSTEWTTRPQSQTRRCSAATPTGAGLSGCR